MGTSVVGPATHCVEALAAGQLLTDCSYLPTGISHSFDCRGQDVLQQSHRLLQGGAQ